MGGENQSSEKGSQIKALEVLLLLSSKKYGGGGRWWEVAWDWDPGQSGLHMLPGATDKQMSLWWQKLGGQLSVSTCCQGAGEVLGEKSRYFFFLKAVSFQESRKSKGEPLRSSE